MDKKLKYMDYNRIRVALAEKKVKSKDLAAAVGVSHNTISRWLNNHRQPSIEKLFIVANFLNVKAGDLLSNNLENKD